MTKQAIIERTIKALNQLPEDKAEEVFVFADFAVKRYEEQLLMRGINRLVSESQAFDFLKNDEDLYTEGDLKEACHGQG